MVTDRSGRHTPVLRSLSTTRRAQEIRTGDSSGNCDRNVGDHHHSLIIERPGDRPADDRRRHRSRITTHISQVHLGILCSLCLAAVVTVLGLCHATEETLLVLFIFDNSATLLNLATRREVRSIAGYCVPDI